MSTARDIAQALREKCGYEVATADESPNQLRLEGRVPEGTTNVNVQNWMLVMNQILEKCEKAEWKADLSKHYMRVNGKFLFGWRIIFQGTPIAPHFPVIIAAIRSSPPTSRPEVMELPLYGASSDRNSYGGGRRGAGPTDRVPVGPAALHMKNMGG